MARETFCPTDLTMVIWVVSGNGQMVNRGIMSIGTRASQVTRAQTTVSCFELKMGFGRTMLAQRD